MGIPAGTDGPQGSDMAATAAVDVTLLNHHYRTRTEYGGIEYGGLPVNVAVFIMWPTRTPAITQPLRTT
jgi:hypothetical protein